MDAMVHNKTGSNEMGDFKAGIKPSEADSKQGRSNCDANLKIMALNDTKAGMQGLDVDKINQIIQDASKGSKFYEHKRKAQVRLDQRVAAMRSELASMTDGQILRAEKQVDHIAKCMESRRDLARTHVHIDMDAFYASVEMRDDPSLRHQPMAVGSMSMLSTSNYNARKFGVRAAMPGFIAKKLCPKLVIVPCNFEKYSKASKEVERILSEYDQDLYMSMDEAYLDLTNYLLERNSFSSEVSQSTPEEVVHEIREKIFQKTGLTASAGIAANGFLAKICGDIKKPNNQYCLPSNIDAIREFVKVLPIRKVCGIGAVTEQMLKGLDVQTCGDLWEKRAIISLLFKPATASFLLAVSLGIGNSGNVFFASDASSDDRKSISCERTFSGKSDHMFLKEMCHELCNELEQDMNRKGAAGKTVTLKIKTTNFEVKTRARTLSEYTSAASVMFDTAWSIYISYENEIPGLNIRLMGVRMSNLNLKHDDEALSDQAVSKEKQMTIEKMFSRTHDKVSCSKEFECPACYKTLESKRSLQDHLDVCLKEHSSGTETLNPHQTTVKNKTVSEPTSCSSASLQQNIRQQPEETSITCPICGSIQKFSSAAEAELQINFHIDECLSKDVVQELTAPSLLKACFPLSSKKRSSCTDGSSNMSHKKLKTSLPLEFYFKPKS